MLVSTIYRHESARGTGMSPPSWASSPTSHPSTPLGCHRALSLSSLGYRATSHQRSALYMVMEMLQCSSLNSSHPLLPPLCLQVCVSIAALQVCSSEPSLEIPYICVNIYSLSDLFHSVLKAVSSSTSLELSQMHSLLWLWVIPFNWYKKGTIFLPWRIVNMLILVDCVFS